MTSRWFSKVHLSTPHSRPKLIFSNPALSRCPHSHFEARFSKLYYSCFNYPRTRFRRHSTSPPTLSFGNPSFLEIARMLWLLNLETCALEIVYGGLEAAPPYAILSHTWGAPEDEFLFQDWTSDLQNELKEALSPNTTTSFQPARAARGYASRKLVGFCLFARSFGLKYGWIDTLCIDKRVSELPDISE